jgi:hypothetical protein
MALTFKDVLNFIGEFDGNGSFNHWRKDVEEAVKMPMKDKMEEKITKRQWVMTIASQKLSGKAKTYYELKSLDFVHDDVKSLLDLLQEEFGDEKIRVLRRENMEEIVLSDFGSGIEYFEELYSSRESR